MKKYIKFIQNHMERVKSKRNINYIVIKRFMNTNNGEISILKINFYDANRVFHSLDCAIWVA